MPCHPVASKSIENIFWWHGWITIFAVLKRGVLIDMERCLSGRKEQFAKLSYWQRYRGFESLSLRWNIFWNIFDSHCGNTIFADLQTTRYLNTMLMKSSGCSVARYRAWFGTRRSQVRILPSRRYGLHPVTKTLFLWQIEGFLFLRPTSFAV